MLRVQAKAVVKQLAAVAWIDYNLFFSSFSLMLIRLIRSYDLKSGSCLVRTRSDLAGGLELGFANALRGIAGVAQGNPLRA